MSDFLSIDEVVNLLGVSKSLVHRNRRAGKYIVQEVKSKGGKGGLKYEIALTSLPEDVQKRYQTEKLAAVSVQFSTQKTTSKTDLVVPRIDIFEQTERQREIARNRDTVLRFVADSGLKVTAAIGYLNSGWALGTLPNTLQYALENAFDKRSPKKLSIRTYWSWVEDQQKRGDLAPQKRKRDFSVKPWHFLALELYRRPQKPTITYVVEMLAKQFNPAPTYRQVEYFFSAKFSQSELLKGRNAGMVSINIQKLPAINTEKLPGGGVELLIFSGFFSLFEAIGIVACFQNIAVMRNAI